MDYLGDITTFTSLLVVCSKTPNFQQIGPRPLRHRYRDAKVLKNQKYLTFGGKVKNDFWGHKKNNPKSWNIGKALIVFHEDKKNRGSETLLLKTFKLRLTCSYTLYTVATTLKLNSVCVKS